MTVRWIALSVAALAAVAPAGAERVTPPLTAEAAGEWRVVRGEWAAAEGVLEQRRPSRGSLALLRRPAFADFALSVEFLARDEGDGVKAAAVAFRAAGTMTYYWLHLDTKNGNAILVRSTPADTWIELGRAPVPLPAETWHRVTVDARGAELVVGVNDREVLRREDATLAAGLIGLGTSQGRVLYRNLVIEGEPTAMAEPLRDEEPPYKVISRGEAAGPYQAFPDVCRLDNGDLLAVFYAGYGHVSLPNDDWPQGGRICMVRSSDEGRTWTEPEVLFDGPADDRDPHVTQLSDGTLMCTFFSLWMEGDTRVGSGSRLVRSRDGGRTWGTSPQAVSPDYYCSAPVREMPDGTLILGVYHEKGGRAWGGVVRSTDAGQTWSEPIPIGQDTWYLDAETDVIRLPDGTLYAALRSSKENAAGATSRDLGLTWTPVEDLGFVAHCPYLLRLRSGEVLFGHRVPGTSLHISRDDCRTWEGPYSIDRVGGAYPGLVELRDGTVLCVYYEEGEGSAVRAVRLRVTTAGLEHLRLD